MDKMISSQKKLNELAAQNADRAVAGAGLEGPDKTRYELVTRELERQKKLEEEIASIRKDNPADTKEQRDRIKQLEKQARLASQIESNQDRGTTAKQLVREQIQFERQKADMVRDAYREQFQLARRAYDLEIAVIDLRRQEADYERAVVDFRLKAENQIAESRNAAAESDLKVARARLELAKTETATRFDQKIYASGGGVEGDALENEKQIQLLKLEGAVQENELRIRTEIAIDKLKRDQIQLQRQWEQEVINLERQRDAVFVRRFSCSASLKITRWQF